MSKTTREDYLLYIAIAIVITTIALAVAQRYVASFISLACALVILSFLDERRCRE